MIGRGHYLWVPARLVWSASEVGGGRPDEPGEFLFDRGGVVRLKEVTLLESRSSKGARN
jgi:hypothetical protein